MPVFQFAVTVPVTMTAMVEVEADSIEEAHQVATSKDFYRDPGKAKFELDEGNALDGAYIPDESDYEEIDSARPGM